MGDRALLLPGLRQAQAGPRDGARPRQLQLQLVNGGASVEVYGSDSVPSSFDGWTANRLASRPDAPQRSTLDFSGDASYRYYLIWFTQLPAGDGGYQDGIAEATLRS